MRHNVKIEKYIEVPINIKNIRYINVDNIVYVQFIFVEPDVSNGVYSKKYIVSIHYLGNDNYIRLTNISISEDTYNKLFKYCELTQITVNEWVNFKYVGNIDINDDDVILYSNCKAWTGCLIKISDFNKYIKPII